MSFFKDFVTGGNYSKLEGEIAYYERVVSFAQKIQGYLNNLIMEKDEVANFLVSEREDAMRNLSLAKNLITRIKAKTGSTVKQEVIKDFNGEFDVNRVDNSDINSFPDFGSTLENFADSTLSTLEHRLSNISDNNMPKSEAKSQMALAGLEIAVGAINGLININSETNNKRREISERLDSLKNTIDNLYNAINSITVHTKRTIEVARVLNKNNEVFSIKYKEIHNLLYSNNGNKATSDKIIIEEDEEKKKLGSLITICSNYSKVNQNARVN